jgi:hypothetical protein
MKKNILIIAFLSLAAFLVSSFTLIIRLSAIANRIH